MARFGVGLILVLDNGDDIAGVISERDIIKALGASDTIVDYAMVGDLMTETVVTVSTDDTLVHAVQVMGVHGIRHLIVVDHDKPVGILSIRGVLKVLASDQNEFQDDKDVQLTKDLIKTFAA